MPQVQYFDKVETQNVLATSGTSAFFGGHACAGSDIPLDGKLGVKGYGMGLTQNELVNNLETIDSFC